MGSHDACERRIAALEAENARLREQIENHIRIRDLGKVERARLFQNDRDRGMTGSQIAKKYGYDSRTYANNRVRILDFGAPAVIRAWDAGQINDTKAESLAREHRSHDEQEAMLRAFLTGKRRR